MASAPEPDLTPRELIARAVAYSQEMHEDFVRAGFYRLYIPRR